MWNRSFNILCLFLISNFYVYTQTVSGKVLDKKTKTPIAYATIYFDNTTIGTTTDENGIFNLDNDNKISSALVITFLGYKKVIIDTIDYNKTYTIFLEEEPYALSEVVISNDDWPRVIKLKEFRKHFLGTTKNGTSCEILNEEDLILRYDKRSKQLTAAAKRPLMIKNKNLSYLITYELQDFYVEYSYVSENTRNYRSTYYAGTSFFKPLEDVPSSKIEKQRQKTFEGSVVHFMRSLSQQRLKEDKYRLFDGSFETTPEKFITVHKIDSLEMYKIAIAKDPKILQFRNDNPTIDFKNRTVPPKSLNILYKRNRQSKFQPKILEFIIDKFGNHYPPDAISFSGDLGEGRFGNTLPLDYKLK